jgi:hypothetical protein
MVVTRVVLYGVPTMRVTCPDCGAPLVGSYADSPRGLELVLKCAVDCGYSRRSSESIPDDDPGAVRHSV